MRYGKKYNYPVYIENGKADDRSPVWSKMTALIRHFEDDKHDWYWALDLDALVINATIRAESFLDDKYDLILTKDCNGFNAGSFFVKNTEWSKAFLALGNLATNTAFKSDNPIPDWGLEQSAMVYYTN